MKISNEYRLHWNFLHQYLPELCFQQMDPNDRIWYIIGPLAGFVSWELPGRILSGIRNCED